MSALIMVYAEIIHVFVSQNLQEKLAKYLMQKITIEGHLCMKLFTIYMEQYQ